MPENGIKFAVRLLRAEGWSCYRIARTLGVSLTDVRCCIDPRADALHRSWMR